jgi:hypothetical protein
MRYGQIINNALQVKFGRRDCDCGKDDLTGCKCKNFNGAAYNIFYTWDEDLTEIVEAYRFSMFPELKRPKVTRPKRPIGELTKKELKDMERVSEKIASEIAATHVPRVDSKKKAVK